MGPGQRPSPGLNKKLLPLMLHQMYIFTDLLEGHLWDKAGQRAALEGLGQCQELKGQYKKVPVGRQEEEWGRGRAPLGWAILILKTGEGEIER